jgi:serine/threonine protein kinase
LDNDRAAFAGQIADVPVPELIRRIVGGSRSGVVRFDTPLGQARVWFAQGALVDADMGRFRMEAAVERLARVEAGTFEIEYTPVTRRISIRTPVADLLARIEGSSPEDAGARRRRRVASWRPTAGGRPRAAVKKADPPAPVLAVRSTEMNPSARARSAGAKTSPQENDGPSPPTSSDPPSMARPESQGPVPARPCEPAARDQTIIGPAPLPSAVSIESVHAPSVGGSITPNTLARASSVAKSIGMPPPETGAPSWVPPADSAPQGAAPAVVGRYEVLLRIARGGMGTVYLCRVTGEGGFRRLFALKVIRDHLSRNPEYVEMMLQEARIASRLHHPNVVGIVDMGTLSDQHYLVMDYIEGCTLSELLKVHQSARPPHLIVPIMLDALTGLHAAHTLTEDDGSPLNLVHCDVSPQNMLVGTNGICRITDFGIARAAKAIHGKGSTGGEHAKVTRGKPAYLSPEQVLGEHLDHRSDIFSAGVVLWNALTGAQLFGGDSPEAILQQVLEHPIPRPSTVGLRPPACFDNVVLRALQRDPSKRYQSAEEMLIELRRLAITQDYLAPASEVAAWVTETFGQQLELRRRAAGISKGLAQDSQPISARDLDRATPADTTQSAEESMSRTAILRPEHKGAQHDAARPLQRLLVLGLAAVGACTLLVIGLVRPDWLRGGIVDDYGDYVVRERPPVGANDGSTGTGTATDADAAAQADAPAGTTGVDAIDTDDIGDIGKLDDTDDGIDFDEIDVDDDIIDPGAADTAGTNEAALPESAGSQAPVRPRRPPASRRRSDPKPSRDASDADESGTPAKKAPPLAPPDLPDLARTEDASDTAQ